MMLENKNLVSDLFPYYFTRCFKQKEIIKEASSRNLFEIKSISRLNPIEVIRTSSTLEYKLHMDERVKIVKVKIFYCSFCKCISKNSKICK